MASCSLYCEGTMEEKDVGRLMEQLHREAEISALSTDVSHDVSGAVHLNLLTQKCLVLKAYLVDLV